MSMHFIFIYIHIHWLKTICVLKVVDLNDLISNTKGFHINSEYISCFAYKHWHTQLWLTFESSFKVICRE